MDNDDENNVDISEAGSECQLLPEDPLLPFTPRCESYLSDRLSTIYETKNVEPINFKEISENPDIKCIYRIELDENVCKEIHYTPGRDMTLPYQYLEKKIVINHIDKYADLSPFFHLYGQLMSSTTDYILLYTDYHSAEDKYLFCAEPMREYEMGSLFLELKEEAVEKLEELSNNPFELEEPEENELKKHEQKCVYGVFNTEYDRGKNIVLSSVEADELYGGYVCFESDECEKKTSKLEIFSHFEKQVEPCILTSKETQTKPYITNNKCIQKDDIFLEEIDNRTNRKVLRTFRKYSDLIFKSASEYRNISLYEGILDKYQRYEKYSGHQRKPFIQMKHHQNTDNWQFIKQSFKVIPHYMEFENISCIAWHPRYVDYVAIAYHGTIHLGKDYFPEACEIQKDFSEKFPQANYLIVIWKVTNELTPTRIITSEFEIACLTFNENYPSLLAGADHFGQILIWDLNNFFSPELFFERRVSTYFGDQHVPWKYIPPIVTFDTYRVDMESHQDYISDIQWFPKKCKERKDKDISDDILSETLVTGSEDGTVKIWMFQDSDSIPKRLQKEYDHQSSKNFQKIDELLYQNKCFVKGFEYVLERVEGEPVPVTAVSCSNHHTTIKNFLQKGESFVYSSLRDGFDRQEKVSCSIIAALCNGKLKLIHAGHTDESTNQEPIDWIDTTKNQKSDVNKKAYRFRHEGPVVSLKRCPYAMDFVLSVSASSFCVWKEGKKKVHPILWNRCNTDKEYTNGDWSSHKTAGLLLLTSCGIVEFWDLMEQDKSPVMTVRAGINTVENAFSVKFSLKEDQIAFIENDLLYFVTIPHNWKKSSTPEGDHLRKVGNHEILRRKKYYAWISEYNEKNKEKIASKIKKFEEDLHAERMKNLSREYNQAKFEESEKLKTPCEKNKSKDTCLPKIKISSNVLAKEEIEMKVIKEFQSQSAMETEEKQSISSNDSLKQTELEDITKEIQMAIESYTIDESEEVFDKIDKFFLSSWQDIDFTDLVKEVEAEFDAIDHTDSKEYAAEEIDNNIDDVDSFKDERTDIKEIEPFNAYASKFADFYSWIRYLDLYYLFPTSVLYDQHVTLIPRGNATRFSLDCEEKFLTGLSKYTPEKEVSLD